MLPSISWGDGCDFKLSQSKETINHESNRLQHFQRKRFIREETRKNEIIPLYRLCLNNLIKQSIFPTYIQLDPNLCHINWDRLPFSLTPMGGLGEEKSAKSRWNRKCNQVEAIIQPIIKIIKFMLATNQNRNIKVVEFCAGSGFCALPLAYLFPQVQFVLVDRKRKSMDIAEIRLSNVTNNTNTTINNSHTNIQKSHTNKLSNVRLVVGEIEDFNETFDIGIALHACGGASDMSLLQCLKNSACFVICPCCIGKILHYRVEPLSNIFRSCCSLKEYKHLIKAADFNHSDDLNDKDSGVCNEHLLTCNDNNNINIMTNLNECIQLLPLNLTMTNHDNIESKSTKTTNDIIMRNNLVDMKKLCKSYIEEDRKRFAIESYGYNVFIYTMPLDSSPKNDCIIGWPNQDIYSDFKIFT